MNIHDNNGDREKNNNCHDGNTYNTYHLDIIFSISALTVIISSF